MPVQATREQRVCLCGCGTQLVGPDSSYALGHHWRVKRRANGLDAKTCDHCGERFTRTDIPGNQNDAHFRQRRYCSQKCSAAAKSRTAPTGEIWCGKCSRWRLPADFWKDGCSNTGYQSYCKDCRRKGRKPAQRSAADQKRANLKRYGITLEEYELMHAAQGGACAICRKPETARNPKGGMKSLAVDHCHKTGKVRGLLCHNCNRGIGHLQDDPAVLRAAIGYLQR